MRTEFSSAVRKAARQRARDNGDLCECGCGFSLTDERVEYHHDLEAYLDGRPTLDNCRAILARCHRRITSARSGALAKVRRVLDARDGVQRLSRAIPGSVRSGLRKGFDGVVRRRSTGLPLSRS